MKQSKVFVYGTLKRGFRNHPFLAHANFLGEAITKHKYPMVNTEGPFPYLINHKDCGHYIKGEVFEIDALTEKTLDILEEYPDFYTKDTIEVIIDTATTEATAYFVREKIEYENLELLEEFIK